MQILLSQLNSVPGVVGSMVCDGQGEVLAHAFPSIFDVGMLAQAARVLAETGENLERSTGSVRLLDLRYDDARIVVRPLAKGTLLFLCSASVNLQPLAISTSVVAPKIERLLAGGAPGQSGITPAPSLGQSGLASAMPVILPNLSNLGWSMPDSPPPPPMPLPSLIPPPQPMEPPSIPPPEFMEPPSMPAPRLLDPPSMPAPPPPAAPPALPIAPPAPEVSKLFTALEKIDAIIARRGLDRFRTRGAIAMKAGFGLGAIDADSPDDPHKLSSLRAAAATVLGEKI